MNLNQLSLQAALDGLRRNDFSSQDLTQACLDQIKKTDSDINSFVTLNKNALIHAKLADKIILKHQSKAFKNQPLLGIPYALKDNFLTKGLRTTASSKVLDSFIPPFNSTVVAKLESAGAIILGKTNMDAWAHGSSTETSDYGPTKNPWNLDHLPGGSSGGSAAATAAHQCIFSIGSETAGSIRQPAAWCGVTGFKPTYGRVSRYGVVAMASSTDSPGPITKTVQDAQLVTAVIAGFDSYDATTSPKPINLSYKNSSKSLKGIKIGLPKEYFLEAIDQKIIARINDAIDVLKGLGAIIKPISLLDPKYAIGVFTIIQRSEVSSNLARYHGVRYSNPRSFFGPEAKRRIMLGTHALSSGYYDQYYNKAQKVRTLIINDFKKAFGQVDLIAGPVSPSTALKLGATKDQAMFGELQDILVEASSIAGLPGLSLPCGLVNGLPVGLQLTGMQFDEAKVLHAGQVFQQNSDWHLQSPPITTKS